MRTEHITSNTLAAPRFALSENVAPSSLTVCGVKIRQDADARYRLNDLHKASGGENRHRPSYWLENQQAVELVRLLETAGIPVVSLEGRNGGTYAVKELVYAYAMWVSPEFHLHVIRTFDAAVSSQVELASARHSRERARLEAPFMSDAVKYSRLAAGKELRPHHFSNEFDLINRLVLGVTSKQYRAEHGLAANDPIRDTLTPCQIKAVEHMQRLNASLIDVGMPFEQRKAKLCQVFLLRHQRALMAETLRLEA